MNQNLQKLLEKTPGIIHTRQGIRTRKIDCADYQDLLRMKTVDHNPAIGNWVQVKKGIYKGDVGRVAATHSWGVDLHLVPRIPTEQLKNKLKRKATTVIPDARLFDPIEFRKNSSKDLVQRSDGSYKAGLLVFQHGLVLKTYDYHSISSEVCEIPWSQYALFSSSMHPEMSPSNLPRPQEWTFVDGSDVIIRSCNKKGTIGLIEADYAEVEIPGEGQHRVPWHDLQKCFNVGDYVCVTGGPNHNRSGWVIETDSEANTAVVVEKIVEGEINKNFPDAIEVSYWHIRSHYIKF